MPVDPVELTRALIRCRSVTPHEGGALDLLQEVLEGLGFAVRRMRFAETGTPDVDNLYARIGDRAPNLCFAGHTDVVPPGPESEWTNDPFAGVEVDGVIHGRGAADMKGAIAAFVAAVARVSANGGVPGSVSLLLTGDEEGPAINGTRKVLDALAEDGERLDACITGEPTNPNTLGEMVKIGRRGSLNAILKVSGVQGHVGYPHLADNPVHRLMAMLSAVTAAPLDEGNEHFQASSLQVTSVDVGNGVHNVIPGEAHARLNIRFNNLHSGATLERWLRETLDGAAEGGDYELDVHVTGESFLTPPGLLSDLVGDAVEEVLGTRPALSTSGGTSDSRFIKDFCPVLDFGLVGATMHKSNEQARVADIHALSRIYEAVLRGYFERA